MWEKIVAFFLSIIAFIASLFGVDINMGSEYVYYNLAYGKHDRQVMDLCLPENNDGEVGLVLMIHGGAWISGDKEGYSSALKTVCNELGYASAAINYRYLGDGVTLHDIADDIEAALTVIKEKGAEKGININKVLLTGGSAGAHLSMFYAYSRAASSPITPVAVVSDCGPTDLTDENFYIDSGLGDEEAIAYLLSLCIGKEFSFSDRAKFVEEIKAVSPLYYVNENTVPTVINHGQKDDIVPYSNALSIVEKFEEYGVTYDFNSYPNSGHGLDSDPENKKIADELIYRYIKTYLGEEATAKW
ncbi:MAG: alpha/beta hydrolase [Clostridia bacterium]|nr:alpha/beta hydrolase [Clostridia bacterium]